jgi:hypothetical protein
MKKRQTITRIYSLLVALAFAGCASSTTELYNDAMSSYRKNNLQEALPKFERLAAQKGDAESYAWLAETNRRLGKRNEALTNAQTSLRLDPCNSFAHTVVADVANPMYGEWEHSNADTTWLHLQRAVACNPRDGNAWMSLWIEAIKKEDTLTAGKALHGMVESGFLTRTALAFGRWLLRGLPADAVLITNGDMDTFPLCAVQETEGFRKDVAVVNRSLLNEARYGKFIRDVVGLPFPSREAMQLERDTLTPSDRIFRTWLKNRSDGTFPRTIALTCTIEQEWVVQFKDAFVFCGSFFIWTTDAAHDSSATLLAKASLEGVQPAEFLGSFISEQDRSPIRRVASNKLDQPVVVTAVMNSASSMQGGNRVEAQRWLDWAEELDTKAVSGPCATEKIKELKKALKQSGN